MLNLAHLNSLGREEFTRVVGPVFEHSPWIAMRAWQLRPFAGRPGLFEALRRTVLQATEEEKLLLIRSHPDLVGKALLTEDSQSEQTAAGLGEISPGEALKFQRYNAEYRAKFGFPFVICARHHKKDSILTAFPERLRNSRETEIDTAINEILKIAELRLTDRIE